MLNVRRYTRRGMLTGFLILLTAGFWSACTVVQQVPYEAEDGNTYRSQTGSDLVRDQIKTSFDSIKRLYNQVTYQTYVFDLDDPPTRDEALAAGIRSGAVESFSDYHSTAGTGVILSNQNGRSAMLTAAHTVSFPDTIWHYRKSPDPAEREKLDAVSVKRNAVHYLFSDDGVVSFDVAAKDPLRDVALMVYNWGVGGDPELKPMEIQPGVFSDLDWTDKIFAVGYPKGFLMVTEGMVSRTESSPRRRFVLDASFNRGFSGGPLFAVRNDGTGLDWMGILSAAYAETEYYLVPEPMSQEEYTPDLEYTGSIYVQREARIHYGITYAVGMDEIGEFFRENRSVVRRLNVRIPN